jgi:hypothetical protein
VAKEKVTHFSLSGARGASRATALPTLNIELSDHAVAFDWILKRHAKRDHSGASSSSHAQRSMSTSIWPPQTMPSASSYSSFKLK